VLSETDNPNIADIFSMSRKLSTHSGWKENIISFLNENKKSWDDLTFWKKFLTKALVNKSSVEAVTRISAANSLTLLLSGDLSEQDLERMFAAVPDSTMKWLRVARLVVLESRSMMPNTSESESTQKESVRPNSSAVEIQVIPGEEKHPLIEASEQQQETKEQLQTNRNYPAKDSEQTPLQYELEEIDFSDCQNIRGDALTEDNDIIGEQLHELVPSHRQAYVDEKLNTAILAKEDRFERRQGQSNGSYIQQLEKIINRCALSPYTSWKLIVWSCYLNDRDAILKAKWCLIGDWQEVKENLWIILKNERPDIDGKDMLNLLQFQWAYGSIREFNSRFMNLGEAAGCTGKTLFDLWVSKLPDSQRIAVRQFHSIKPFQNIRAAMRFIEDTVNPDTQRKSLEIGSDHRREKKFRNLKGPRDLQHEEYLSSKSDSSRINTINKHAMANNQHEAGEEYRKSQNGPKLRDRDHHTVFPQTREEKSPRDYNPKYNDKTHNYGKWNHKKSASLQQKEEDFRKNLASSTTSSSTKSNNFPIQSKVKFNSIQSFGQTTKTSTMPGGIGGVYPKHPVERKTNIKYLPLEEKNPALHDYPHQPISQTTNNTTSSIERVIIHQFPETKIVINGNETTATIDTMSMTSFITKDFQEKLHLDPVGIVLVQFPEQFKPCARDVVEVNIGLNGQTLKNYPLGVLNLPDPQAPVILGLDLLTAVKLEVTVDCKMHEDKFKEYRSGNVAMTPTTKQPQMSNSQPETTKSQHSQTMEMTEDQSLIASHSVMQLSGSGDASNNDVDHFNDNGNLYHPRHDDFMQEIKADLDANLANINRPANVPPFALPFSDEAEKRRHHWQPQRYLGSQMEKAYEEQVVQWLKDGIIRPLQPSEQVKCSQYNSRIFGVKQSDKIRFVADFRHINNLLIDDTNDVPVIDDELKRLGDNNGEYLSKLDLKSAYLQIPVAQCDQRFLAFTCNGRRYCFTRIPFGLKQIPSWFNRLVQSILQEADIHAAKNFFDDLRVQSKDRKQHIDDVRKTLRALTKVGFVVNQNKCIFAAKQLRLLGFLVSGAGVSIDKSRVFDMDKWSRPSTRKQLQKLIGFINYSRRFIPNCSEKLAPLINAMTDKTKRFQWNAELESSYWELFQSMMTSTMLHFPDANCQLEVRCDASDSAIGCHIFQWRNGKMETIALNSKKLSGSQCKYTIPKKELYAAIIFLRKYEDLLGARHFLLRIDNEAIATLLQAQNGKLPEDKILANWIVGLQQFNFDCKPIKGTENVVADYMSRIQNINTIPTTGNSQNNLATDQDHPPSPTQREISELSRDNHNHEENVPTQTNSSVESANNIEEDRHQSERMLREISSEELHKLLNEIHSHGHFGEKILKEYIENVLHYTHPLLASKCKQLCDHCVICNKVNAGKLAFAPQRFHHHTEPMQNVYMDFMEIQKSASGMKWILVAVDYATKFVWLRACENKSSTIQAEFLNMLMSNFGRITELSTDNEFDNKEVNAIGTKWNMSHRLALAYNHQSMGPVERYNRTVRYAILKTVMDKLDGIEHWDDIVDDVQYWINTNYNSSIKCSPFDLMFGRNSFGQDATTTTSNVNTTNNIVAKQQSNTVVNKWDLITKTREQLRNEKFKQFSEGKKKIPTKVLKPGQLVMAVNNHRRSKSDLPYDGPFRVGYHHGDGNLDIQNDDGYIIETRPTPQLKKFKGKRKPLPAGRYATANRFETLSDAVDQINDEDIIIELNENPTEEDLKRDDRARRRNRNLHPGYLESSPGSVSHE